MLNELALLKNGIEAVDPLALKRIHPSIGEPGKAHLVRIVLGEHKIIELERLDGGRNENYWTQGDGNKNQFPAVKLPYPIRPSGVEEFRKWKEGNKNTSVECLESLRKNHQVHLTGHKHWPSYRQKLVEQAEIYSHLQDDSKIVHRLVETYLSFEDNGLELLKKFDEFLWQKCKEENPTKELLNLAALAMFGDGQKLNNKGMISGGRITLLLDLDIEDNNGYSAAHHHWVPKLSELLFNNEKATSKIKKTNTDTCAISGLSGIELVTNTFPAPKCKILGKVKIFSRKKDVHTYKRYNEWAAKSYPLSNKLADEFASALRYLNDKEQGTTWDKLPAENGGVDLLIAFCRDLSDVNMAKLIAYDRGEDDFLDEFGYEEECKQICESFKGRDIKLGIEPVDFLILRKISDGVQKAIFSSSQPVDQLEQASESWNSACKNTPPITLKLFKKGDKVPKDCPPRPISPKQFASLLCKNYTRSIDEKPKTVPGSAFSDVMALFLNDARAPALANRLLQKMIKQFANLLEIIAVEKRIPEKLKGSKSSKKTIKHHDKALRAITAMSLLLNKLNRQKEVYMKEIAYKLGQFCAVLDEIHIGYCVSERQGKIPSRLIGNQAYTAAVVNPKKALEITAQRIAVYKAWAEKNSRNENNKLKPEEKRAKYAYFWLRDNCAEIHQLIPEKIPRSTPESKTELLLGYLAGRPFENKKPAEPATSTSV